MLQKLLAILLLAWVILSAFPNRQAHAQTDSSQIVKEEFFKAWQERRDLQAFGDDQLGIEAIDNLIEKRFRISVRNLPFFSMALLRQADELVEKGHKNEAETLIQKAAELSPSLEEPQWARAKFHLSTKFSLGEVLGALASIVKILITELPLKLRAINNATVYVYASCLFAILILLAVTCILFIRLIINDARERLRFKLPAVTVFFLCITLVLSGYVLIGLAGVILPVAMLIWPHLFKAGRRVLLSLILILVSTSGLLYVMSPSFNVASGAGLDMVMMTYDPDITPRVEQVERYLEEHSNNTVALLTLANAYKAMGNTREAILKLERAIAIDGNFEKAITNLANLEYAQGGFQEAITRYKRLLQVNPSNFLANFNLGKIYYEEAFLEEGNQALRRAKLLDPERFESLDAVYTQYNLGNSFLLDTRPNWSEIKTSLGNVSTSVPTLDSNLPIPFFLSIAMFTVLIIFGLISRKLPRTYACQKCGVLTYTKVDEGRRRELLCVQCEASTARNSAVDPEMKIRKEREIRQYQNRQAVVAKLASCVFPGAGQMLIGSTTLGAIILLIAALLLTPFFPITYVPAPFYFPVMDGFITVAGLILFSLVYVGSLFHLFGKS